MFKREEFFKHQHAEITWQSLLVGSEDWSDDCHHLAFILHGEHLDEGDDDFFIMMNGDRTETVEFQLPEVPQKQLGGEWRKIIDTAAVAPQDLVDYKKGEKYYAFDQLEVPAQTVVVLQAVIQR